MDPSGTSQFRYQPPFARMITKHSALSVDLWESGNYTSFPVLDIGYHSTWGLVDKRINDLLHIVRDEHTIAIRRPTLGENHDKSD
jgi:hypothetical protein